LCHQADSALQQLCVTIYTNLDAALSAKLSQAEIHLQKGSQLCGPGCICCFNHNHCPSFQCCIAAAAAAAAKKLAVLASRLLLGDPCQLTGWLVMVVLLLRCWLTDSVRLAATALLRSKLQPVRKKAQTEAG